MQFYQSEPAYVKFDYNIPRGASIGVYARRNALPTHTQYHFKEVLSGFNARTTRSTHVSFRNYSSFFFLSIFQRNWCSSYHKISFFFFFVFLISFLVTQILKMVGRDWISNTIYYFSVCVPYNSDLCLEKHIKSQFDLWPLSIYISYYKSIV